MAAPTADRPSETGLPFSMATLTGGLEAGIGAWRSDDEKEPLMRPLCDVSSIAIKKCLERRDVPTHLLQTVGRDEGPLMDHYHVIAVAEPTTGSVAVDGTYGQFLHEVAGEDYPELHLVRQRFKQLPSRCIAFRPHSFEEAISRVVDSMFGPDAGSEIVERAHSLYGALWDSANLRPYKPHDNERDSASRLVPHLEEVLALR